MPAPFGPPEPPPKVCQDCGHTIPPTGKPDECDATWVPPTWPEGVPYVGFPCPCRDAGKVCKPIPAKVLTP